SGTRHTSNCSHSAPFSFASTSYLCHSSPLFFFHDSASTEIYTLSLHDALPIYFIGAPDSRQTVRDDKCRPSHHQIGQGLLMVGRSEEHTSELQSRGHLVCRLLLEKKICSRVLPCLGTNATS